MTDRTVVYRIQADVTQAQAKLAALGASARKAGGDLGSSLQANSTKASSALDGLGINAGTVAVGLGAAMVVAAANFDKSMSSVQAATHESTANMDALRQAALDAGAQTSFSATEAASGIEELAKAGVSTTNILNGGLAGALDLAAAGGLGVAEASETAATALTQFKLQGEDVPHVADLLAAAAGKAQGSVSDMGAALKQSGLVAAQVGLTIEETTGTLAAFASAGLTGSDAGTSFKTFLQSLTPSSKAAREAMEAMNFSAYDAQGNFKGMAAVAGELRAGLAGMSKEQQNATLKTIFGSDAVRAAAVIYEQGAEGISGWTDNVNDAGYAAETAAIQMDNLKGDVEALKGAIETAFIESGSDSQGGLRGITQLATDTVNLSTEVEKADGFLGGLRDTATGALSPLSALGSNVAGLKDFLSGTDEKTEDLDKKTESLAQTSTAAAGGLDAQAVSLRGVEGATRQTAQEMEALKKATDDARKAAREQAASFGQLGSGLDDAKVSLGDWIGQMAEFADAVTNFGNNAKKASNRGLRDGLIADLQDAGEAGALRMKQLANATDEEIARANRAWKRGEDAMERYVNFKVPPKELEVDNGAALTAIERIRAALAEIKDKSVTVRVTQTGAGVTPGFGPQANAAGGFITGPGTATSDSIPSYLSNGEYVVKAAAVQKYGTHMFDSLNAMRFAGGGKVEKGKKKRNATGGFDSAMDFGPGEQAQMQAAEAAEQYYAAQALAQREAERRAAEAERLAEEQAERQRAHDDAVLSGQQKAWDQMTTDSQKRVDLAQQEVDAVEASMDRIGQAATSAFSGSWFSGGSQQRGMWAGGSGSGDWRSQALGDIAGLQERGGLIAQLSAQGLTGKALEDLLGNQSNAGISAMLAGGEIGDYKALFAQREALMASVGQQAGVAGYGAEYAAASVEMAQMNAQFAALTAAIQAARPITVLESVSAEATAAEIARLMSMMGAA